MSKQISLEQVIDTITTVIGDSSNEIVVEQDCMEFDGNSVTVTYDRKFHLPVYVIEHEDQEFTFEDLNGVLSEEVKLVFEQGTKLNDLACNFRIAEIRRVRPFVTEQVKENPAIYEILTGRLIEDFESGQLELEEPKFYISLATLA
jgi:hypothetical protein